MYCRRNQMIAFIDGFCSVGLIPLELIEVTKEETLENDDMDSVDLDELHDVVSQNNDEPAH